MEIGWLRDFEALVAHRNFSRAAEERHASQPALSRRIRALEQAVGARLIDRETLPLSLTPAGEVFLSQARQILRTWADTVERCQTVDAAGDAVVRFATTHSLYTTHYQTHIAPLADGCGVETDLNSTSWGADQFVSALQQRYCDAILVYWHPTMEFLAPLDVSNFQHLTLSRDRFVLLTGVDEHGGARFELDDTKAQVPFLSYSTASALRPVQDHLLGQTARAKKLFTVNQNTQANSVKAMILEGFGIGWLPPKMCETELTEGRVAVVDPAMAAELEIRLYIDVGNPKPALHRFWDQVSRAIGQV